MIKDGKDTDKNLLLNDLTTEHNKDNYKYYYIFTKSTVIKIFEKIKQNKNII